jgi:hypothetical protein
MLARPFGECSGRGRRCAVQCTAAALLVRVLSACGGQQAPLVCAGDHGPERSPLGALTRRAPTFAPPSPTPRVITLNAPPVAHTAVLANGAERWRARFRADSLEGAVLLCYFAITDGVVRDRFLGLFAQQPDIAVWAQFGAERGQSRVAFGASKARFAFRTAVARGERVKFVISDQDVFERDDFVDKLESTFEGDVPFSIVGPSARADCEGVPKERVAAWASAVEGQLERALDALEGAPVTDEDAVDAKALARAEQTVSLLAELRGKEDAVVKQALERATRIGQTKWEERRARLERKAATLPGKDAWVALDANFDGRVSGLACRPHGYAGPMCNLELELRVREPLSAAMCPEDRWERLGPFALVMSTGEAKGLTVERVLRGDDVVTDVRAFLPTLDQGATFSLELHLFAREGEALRGKLLRVGQTKLRID